MSFWEDASPAVKGILIVGVLALVYLVVARIGQFVPFGCPNDGECSGVLCLDCEAPEGAGAERGFQQGSGVAAE